MTSVNYGSYADALLLFKAMVVPTVSCVLYIYSIVYQHSSALFLALTSLTPFLFAVSCPFRQTIHQSYINTRAAEHSSEVDIGQVSFENIIAM